MLFVAKSRMPGGYTVLERLVTDSTYGIADISIDRKNNQRVVTKQFVTGSKSYKNKFAKEVKKLQVIATEL